MKILILILFVIAITPCKAQQGTMRIESGKLGYHL